MGFRDAYRGEMARLAAPDKRPVPISQAQTAAALLVQPEPVLLPGFCNLYRLPFLILADRHGRQLKLRRSEHLPSGFDSYSAPPATELGNFPLDASGWTGCAHCGTRNDLASGRNSVWWCVCEHCDGTVLFHCAGHRGAFRCVNGILQNRHPAGVPTVPAQGWRSGPTPQQPAPHWREPTPYHAPLPQLPNPSSTTLRIGFRGGQS